MIEEVLKEIKSAEETASEMQSKAFQEGKQIVLDAELKAEKERKETVLQCKADFRRAIAEAEETANARRTKIIENGEISAKEYVESKSAKIDEKADELVGVLLDKYIK